MIPFNKPYLHGKELDYIREAVSIGKISGDGEFTKKCHAFFERKYHFNKVLLTTSCTDALEMAAILLNIQPSDEIIAPSFTFVSTVNAFALRGAKLVFADCGKEHPNIDADTIESLITKKTKAIVVVHYAGVPCDMEKIMKLSKRYDIPVVEDAAQAIDSFYKGVPLGSIGTFGTFSFHESKNIISGEGGMLTINDKQFSTRAEIIREKGTNRSSFFRGEVDKYSWVDVGSSFLPSDIIAAYLYAQLEQLDTIQYRRKLLWNRYYEGLTSLEGYAIKLPYLPPDESNNAHMFYLTCINEEYRSALIQYLKANGVHAVSHYHSLHNSPYYFSKYHGLELVNSDRFAKTLVRLPLFYELKESEVDIIVNLIHEFSFKNIETDISD